MKPSLKQQRRDEALWQASRIAHAVLGLDEPDEQNPSGVNRKAALTALAYQFLDIAHRKHIPVLTRPENSTVETSGAYMQFSPSASPRSWMRYSPPLTSKNARRRCGCSPKR